MSPWALNRFVRAVSRGAVFGYPTDTVWGLGCHPLIAASVVRLLQLKHRTPDKGLILLSSRLEFCLPYIDAESAELEPLRQANDRPTTWLVPAGEFCPVWIRGAYPTVAVRITAHPLLQFVCEGLESPLVSTSANRSGRPTVRSALQMRRQFGDRLDYIVSGYSTGGDRPSEIKSLASGTILRSAT
ncbi:MAG TPA: L-threonylcarbamoyladenylate synthase [Gammaproteobacteria bacterium]|nr:L-threonylcarbamoyladenylate synthase [Gammaproteobacteria bacterium]